MLNFDVGKMSDSLSETAFLIALQVLSKGPDRADKFIVVTTLVPRPRPNSSSRASLDV